MKISIINANTSSFSIRWMVCSKYIITGNFQTVIIIWDASFKISYWGRKKAEWGNIAQDQWFVDEILTLLFFWQFLALRWCMLFCKPHCCKKIFAQYQESKSIHFKCLFCLLAMKTFAVATATAIVTTPHFFLSTFIKVFTFSSNLPNMKDLFTCSFNL